MLAIAVALSAVLQTVAAAAPQEPALLEAKAQPTPAPAPPPGPRLHLRFPALPAAGAAERAGSPSPLPVVADTPQPRARAVEHSDAYYTRLTVHRIGSYAIVPLFAAQYVVGQKLANGTAGEGLKGVHNALAVSVIGLFGLNTITGVWNLWDSRHDEEGRARRLVHSVAMLAADGGFAATAALTPEHEGRFDGFGGFRESGGVSTATHRGIAIGSMALATASTVVMWLWK